LYDVTFTSGQQRFRGQQSYGLRAPAGTIRIVALGDSFTFGDGVNDVDAYPNVLEQRLKARGFPVEVLNAGMLGHGIGLEALYFDEYVSQFHPDIVVLQVFQYNDFYELRAQPFAMQADGSIVPRTEPAAGTDGWLRGTLHGIHRSRVMRWVYSHSRLFTLASNLASRVTEDRRDAQIVTPQKLDDARKLIAAEIGWLNQRVTASGAKLMVVYTPSLQWTYEAATSEEAAHEKGVSEAARRGAEAARVPFFDLTPEMRAAHGGSVPLFYSGMDEHPNPRGYAAIAESVAKHLMETGMLFGGQRP
jgi:lysophospholipase L1-like esterase